MEYINLGLENHLEISVDREWARKPRDGDSGRDGRERSGLRDEKVRDAES
jgi:hypothetical protein